MEERDRGFDFVETRSYKAGIGPNSHREIQTERNLLTGEEYPCYVTKVNWRLDNDVNANDNWLGMAIHNNGNTQ